METYRDGKLKKLIARCYENVPYYRAIMNERCIQPKDIRCVADLSKLPLLTREIARMNRKELLSRNTVAMSVSWGKTGGTTGEPMQICRNEECSAWGNMCHERGLGWGGLTADKPRIKLFGGSLGIDRMKFASRFGSIFRRDLFLPAFELRADTAAVFIDKIRRSGCNYLIGYTSAIFNLAKFVDELNQKVRFHAVFPTAELLLPEWEELIRKVFQCHVLPYYGCGEINSLGYCHPESSYYLIQEEHVIIEVMQRDGTAELCGDGRFVITDLDNYAMPLIRYVNGDAGKVAASSNGHIPFSRIERLDGRYNSFLMTDAGDLISGAMGPHILRLFPSVKTYRIVQEERLRIVISVVPKEDFSEKDRFLITDLFSKHLGSRMKIIIETVPSITVPPS
jgi:phenylacetate-CoA ligase